MKISDFEYIETEKVSLKKKEKRTEYFLPSMKLSTLKPILCGARNTLPTFLSILFQYHLNQKKEFRFSYTSTNKYFGVCKSTAQKHIKKLEKEGVINVFRAKGSSPRIQLK